MARRNALFLKWFPLLSRDKGSRWQRLNPEERGVFFELYCWAALCKPRGSLYTSDGVPLTVADFARDLGITRQKMHRIVRKLSRNPAPNAPNSDTTPLLSRTESGAFFFADWAFHQRKGPFRLRPEDKNGPLWGTSGA